MVPSTVPCNYFSSVISHNHCQNKLSKHISSCHSAAQEAALDSYCLPLQVINPSFIYLLSQQIFINHHHHHHQLHCHRHHHPRELCRARHRQDHRYHRRVRHPHHHHLPRLTTATTSTHRHRHPRHHIFHFPTMTQRRGRGIQQLASLLFEPSAPQNSHLHDRLLVITGFSRSLTAHRTRLIVLVLNNSSLRSLLHY